MSSHASHTNSRRIARNTGFLYIRMFVMLAVGLFTARIVLQALGETDYGIYNIVGGVVVLFSFLNQALTSATQRYLNFHLGRDDHQSVSTVFCMSMNAYLILSGVFIVLAETVGLWFVNTQLNIPPERMTAANWVYQLTVITFVISLLRVPYNATIIAYERMDFFAYVSLGEAVVKLGVVYLLFVAPWDRLVFYTALYTAVALLTNLVYWLYCVRQFTTARFQSMWDGSMFRSLFSFSGWSLFGSAANMLAIQGLNILINIFFGVVANAAVGIAQQVANHVMQFVSSFQTAFQPQIVKNYAAGQIEEFNKLIFQTSKFSFYLIFIVGFPFMLVAQSFLEIWLTEVPPDTAIFCQLMLGFMFIEGLTAPLWMGVQATGNIRNYQMLMALCIFSNFPLTWLVFRLGMPVYWAWVIRILVNVLTFWVRLLYMRRHLAFPIATYLGSSVVPIIKVCALVVPIPVIMAHFIPVGLVKLVSVAAVAVVLTAVVVYFVGLTASEREFARQTILSKFLKKKQQRI